MNKTLMFRDAAVLVLARHGKERCFSYKCVCQFDAGAHRVGAVSSERCYDSACGSGNYVGPARTAMLLVRGVLC